jgi:hypothetical protein
MNLQVKPRDPRDVTRNRSRVRERDLLYREVTHTVTRHTTRMARVCPTWPATW